VIRVGVIYFLTVALIGFPIMYASYVLLNGLFTTFGVSWFVQSAYGLMLVAIAFLIEIKISGKISTTVIGSIRTTAE